MTTSPRASERLTSNETEPAAQAMFSSSSMQLESQGIVSPHVIRLPGARRPTILHARVVCDTGGGPDKTILNSPRFVEPYGYRMLCAYLHPPGDPGFEQLRQRAEACQATLVGIADRGPFDLRAIRALIRLCREEQVTIWHGHDYKSNSLGLLLKRFWPMRLVTTVHGWIDNTRRLSLYNTIDRFALRHYERVVCVSENLRQRCLEAGIRPERCLVIENGIDLDYYRRTQSTAEAKQRVGIAPNRLVVGAVGRLSLEKGFDLLIQAIGRLVEQRVDVQLVVVGEGDQRANLEREIVRLGLTDRVLLAGFRSDTLDWYQAMDVYCLSSLTEGLPNVVLEAMALEVPVVATKVAGVPDLLGQGASGVLVDPGDVAALTAALARVLADEAGRRRFGEAGRHTVENNYSFAKRMEKIRGVYEQLL
jgi:glycosyltransferase involved in cell wall biosynthesis